MRPTPRQQLRHLLASTPERSLLVSRALLEALAEPVQLTPDVLDEDALLTRLARMGHGDVPVTGES